MNKRILAIVLVLACVMVAVVRMNIIPQQAHGRDFGAKTDQSSSKTQPNATTTESASKEGIQADSANKEPIATSSASDRLGNRQGYKPGKSNRFDMRLTNGDNGVVVAIMDTETGVVRMRTVRSRLGWQELSFDELDNEY